MNDRVAVGRFGKPYGVHGWIKVISYTVPIQNILNYLPWHIAKGQENIIIDRVNGKLHGERLIVKLGQCHDPEEAKAYTNLEIFITRDQLPPLQKEEYYWIDLIGLTVINKEYENLGVVKRIFPTGSNDVLIVKDNSGKERYLPYTDSVIIEVNLEEKKLLVDWDSTF